MKITLGVVLEDHAFEQRSDDVSVFGRHARDGFKMEAQIVAGATLVGIEQQRVAADAQDDGQPAQTGKVGCALPAS